MGAKGGKLTGAKSANIRSGASQPKQRRASGKKINTMKK